MGAGLSRGSAAGRWYGPAPHASRALRVPAGPAAPALDPRVPAGPGQGEAAGRAVPCPLVAPRRLGRDGSLPSGGYRSALDRLRDRRRGCPAGKVASFVGAASVRPLMSRADLVRGLSRLGPLLAGRLAAAPAGSHLGRDGPVLGDDRPWRWPG